MVVPSAASRFTVCPDRPSSTVCLMPSALRSLNTVPEMLPGTMTGAAPRILVTRTFAPPSTPEVPPWTVLKLAKVLPAPRATPFPAVPVMLLAL